MFLHKEERIIRFSVAEGAFFLQIGEGVISVFHDVGDYAFKITRQAIADNCLALLK